MSTVDQLAVMSNSWTNSWPNSRSNSSPNSGNEYTEEYADVVIGGGGIGGYSTAHFLRKHGFIGKVVIIEARSVGGGVARSGSIPHTGTGDRKDLPSEYCWRIEGPVYKTLFEILKDVPNIDPVLLLPKRPDISKEDQASSGHSTYRHSPSHNHPSSGKETPRQKSLFQNLIPIRDYLVGESKSGSGYRLNYGANGVQTYLKRIWDESSWSDLWHVADKLLYSFTSCFDRIRHELGDLTWIDYMQNGNQRPLPRKLLLYLVYSFGPLFGVDLYKVSASSILENIDSMLVNTDSSAGIYVLNAPTSEALFVPWEKHLIDSLRVDIRKNTVLEHISFISSSLSLSSSVQTYKVDYVITRDKITGDRKKIYTKWFICALPIEVACQLVTPMQKQLTALRDASLHEMIGAQLYFDEPVTYPPPTRTAIYLPETPYQLVIEPQGYIWKTTPIEHYYGDGNVRDIWSIGFCDPRSHGWIHDKPWVECTLEELKEECMYQIMQTRGFSELLRGGLSGKPFDQINCLRFELWHTSKYDYSQRRIINPEPKSGPNAGTLKLRPFIRPCMITNLRFATVYTRGSREMYLMDAAAEAGKMAAKSVLVDDSSNPRAQNNSQNITQPKTIDRGWPVFLAPLRVVDYILFHGLGFPHLSSILTFGSSSLLLLLYICLLGYLIVQIIV